jgi:hypothetical protein
MVSFPRSAQQSKLRIVQTNSAGDNIHILDPVANKVGRSRGSKRPWGYGSPDGSRSTSVNKRTNGRRHRRKTLQPTSGFP